MSVSLPSESPCPRPSCRCSRALRTASRVSYAIWGIVSIFAIISTMITILFALQFWRIFDFPFFAGQVGIEDVVSWLLSSVQLDTSAIVLWHVRKLFEDASESGVPFGERQARRMKLVAASLALGLLASWLVAFAFCVAGEAQIVGLAYPMIPFYDMAAGDLLADQSGPIALSLDFTGLFLAALAWGLSFLFEYGGWLERENEQIV